MTYEEAYAALYVKLQAASKKTLQQLFDEMVELGLKCQRSNCATCLVAEYLNQDFLPNFNVIVGCDYARLVPVDKHATVSAHLRLPFVLQQLVYMFDCGAIPELDAYPYNARGNELPFGERIRMRFGYDVNSPHTLAS